MTKQKISQHFQVFLVSRIFLISTIIISILSFSFHSFAQSQNSPRQSLSQPSELKLFDGFWENVGESFSGSNLLFHAAAFGLTPILIKTGVDGRVYDHFRRTQSEFALGGAVIGSGAVALLAGGWLYYSGNKANDQETMGAAYVMAQAALITVSYVALLKFTTGRAHPTNSWSLSPQDQSEQWQFGFLKNGLTAYGWPSGHVSHTVAVTSALAYYYPNKPWLVWLGVGLSGYMIYTVSAYDSGQMHWFSDGVAGAFIGYSIGSTVGKNFRNRLNGSIEKPSSVTWLPMVDPGFLGAMALIDF